ncbi:hypothetical protein ACFL1G_02890 [Planctomycetota bacterium]
MSGTIDTSIIVYWVLMMLTLALAIGFLERIEKKLKDIGKDIDFGMKKIQQVLEHIEEAIKESK